MQLPNRSLPLLQPMSEVAGRLSTQVGAYHLMRATGGRGILLGGVPGTPKAKVVVIGGGVAGEHAAANALGMRRRRHDHRHLASLACASWRTASAGRSRPGRHRRTRSRSSSRDADLVIGSVLIPGAQAPKLVTDAMVADMKPGSVLVDIAIDQGGCFEGSRPTTHDDPTFAVHDSLYYCVANMPGAVPETSTRALTNATLRYALAIADQGTERSGGGRRSAPRGRQHPRGCGHQRRRGRGVRPPRRDDGLTHSPPTAGDHPRKRRNPGLEETGISSFLLQGQDLNLRPLGYEPSELPNCSTLRHKR